jgi:c-di-GMP-binding flagellar brake protein YcgR
MRTSRSAAAAGGQQSEQAATSGSEQKETRRQRRRTIRKTCGVVIQFEIGFTPGGSTEMEKETHKTRGKLLDISESGACVLTKYELGVKQDIELTVDLQGMYAIMPKARVCWSKPVPEKRAHLFGLQFHPLSTVDQESLDHFLKALDEQLA